MLDPAAAAARQSHYVPNSPRGRVARAARDPAEQQLRRVLQRLEYYGVRLPALTNRDTFVDELERALQRQDLGVTEAPRPFFLATDAGDGGRGLRRLIRRQAFGCSRH